VAGTDRDFVVLPYDFDQSGVVDADYAQADRRLGISQVTERVYRGFCWHNDYLADSVRAYNERRAEIEAAFPPATMSKKQYRRVQRYIRNFYKTINDPEELQSRLLDKCRGPDSFSPQASPESPDHPGTP
jgi:hypothetical protein